MTVAAELRAIGGDVWEIVENGEVRATYPSKAVRLSLVWKADLDDEDDSESLNLNRVMSIFIADLRSERLIFVSQRTRCRTTWIATLIASTARFQMRLTRKNETRIKPGRDYVFEIARSLLH